MTTSSESGEAPSAAPRTEALEQLLTERGLIDPEIVDAFITNYETNVGPLNGAKVVAKAWTDPEYRRRLLADGTSAIKELGFGGPQGEHIVVEGPRLPCTRGQGTPHRPLRDGPRPR